MSIAFNWAIFMIYYNSFCSDCTSAVRPQANWLNSSCKTAHPGALSPSPTPFSNAQADSCCYIEHQGTLTSSRGESYCFLPSLKIFTFCLYYPSQGSACFKRMWVEKKTPTTVQTICIIRFCVGQEIYSITGTLFPHLSVMSPEIKVLQEGFSGCTCTNPSCFLVWSCASLYLNWKVFTTSRRDVKSAQRICRVARCGAAILSVEQ